jgi:lyso-ornithine lipid O-acyltransferase
VKIRGPGLRGVGRGAVRAFGLLVVIAWALLTRALARDGARWLQRTCARGLRVLHVRVSARGRPPTAGAFWASNHLGYLDILVLAAQAPVVFVAKREVRGWPIFGTLAALAGTLFIDRARSRAVAEVGTAVARTLATGRSVAVFLEGTSSAGNEVLPFRPSLLAPLASAGGLAAPVAVGYALPAGYDPARQVCWWGDMTLTPHLGRLLTLPQIEARVAWAEPLAVAPGEDRKALSATLHARVSAARESLTTT